MFSFICWDEARPLLKPHPDLGSSSQRGVERTVFLPACAPSVCLCACSAPFRYAVPC